MDTYDIKAIAKKLQESQDKKVAGESFYVSLAREACNGIKKHGKTKTQKDLEHGAYLGLSYYYPAWSDWMNKEFAREIANIIYNSY
jgi:hypothetical protein